jgi:hypothetical protein
MLLFSRNSQPQHKSTKPVPTPHKLKSNQTEWHYQPERQTAKTATNKARNKYSTKTKAIQKLSVPIRGERQTFKQKVGSMFLL